MRSQSCNELNSDWKKELEEERTINPPKNGSNRLATQYLRIKHNSVRFNNREELHEIAPLIETCPRRSSANEMSAKQSTKLKVRTEKSAMVLGLIVILFIFTHSYRMALKLYELSSPNAHTIEKFKYCYALKRYYILL